MDGMQFIRIAAGVEYDGSRFCGWQMQAHGVRTVQDAVQNALQKIANHPVQVTCAGRTDSGVHATGQVIHFDTNANRPDKAWVLGCNTHLPDDVCIHWARQVVPEFSARFSATRRRYRYVILHRQARPALYSGRVSWIHGALDAEAMHVAARALLGEQDFSSFRSAACQAEHARRFMESITVSRQGDYIYIDVCANAFLHHMVRNIVGSLVKVGKGERSPEWIAQILEMRDRTRAGPTAPAAGLYLVAVQYPQHYELPDGGMLPVFASAD
jgi:tRNA pseudouridine38-40 synthase